MIYDSFQKEAIAQVEDGFSVIVAAPTGAGKTVIAEYVIEDCLVKNRRVIYTAPIKALSNQKFRQFSERFGDKIGILTGDVSINAHAPVLIMTTEIFRNKLLEKESDIGRYSWIIFDEIHFLDDYERGSVWEESLIFLPDHMAFLGLSATVPNIHEIARWIESIHRKPVKIVTETARPVPLHFFYQCRNEFFDSLNSVKKTGYGNTGHGWRQRSRYGHREANKVGTLINHVEDHGGLPCIYFAFGRKRCEYLAQEISSFDFLSLPEKNTIIGQYEMLCDRFNLSGEKSAALLLPLIERGIAFHHAGMLPTLKETIERLFTGRLIKVIFTTETFALGINMPARSVIFDDLRKFYGRFHRCLKTRDFFQMAGRAGRRGLDKEGFVFSRVDPRSVPFHELNRIVYGKHEAVQSQFNTQYATVLHLYDLYNENLYDVYPKSLHYHQRGKQAQKRAYEQLAAKVHLLKTLGYLTQQGLTEKGVFASKIYGYELSLGELYERGILETLSEKELACLALALVFEPKKGLVVPRLPKSARRLRSISTDILRHIHAHEKRLNILRLSKSYSFELSAALSAWMSGEAFHRLSAYANVDEGELIRYFRMAVQILREILETAIPSELAAKLKRSIALINRDIIDAEKQLRL